LNGQPTADEADGAEDGAWNVLNTRACVLTTVDGCYDM